LPCSPLYNFIRYSSLEDLKRYTIENWSGQYLGLELHGRMKENGFDESLSLLCESFNHEKHGKTLKNQEDDLYLDKLYEVLRCLSVKLTPGRIEIVKGNLMRKAEPMRLKSAYAEDFAVRNKENTEVSALVGEMKFSTIPKQDPYPVTTDYVLYGIFHLVSIRVMIMIRLN
jgi:hypothetical protein